MNPSREMTILEMLVANGAHPDLAAERLAGHDARIAREAYTEGFSYGRYRWHMFSWDRQKHDIVQREADEARVLLATESTQQEDRT